jgi:hypothetical protein
MERLVRGSVLKRPMLYHLSDRFKLKDGNDG